MHYRLKKWDVSQASKTYMEKHTLLHKSFDKREDVQAFMRENDKKNRVTHEDE